MSDAFLAERDAHCVRDAASPVKHAFGACKNASHHLSQRSGITYHLFAKRVICDVTRKCEMYIMSESKLRELSMEFSVDIIELVKYLKSSKESIISSQIDRSARFRF